MLKSLREMFGSKPVVAEPPVDGEMTLADVLSRGWFELYYQPKVELKTMRLCGAEALVRARHPQRGVLTPGVFLPGAGEADMLALTERVIIKALKDWDDFALNGQPLEIAVNVPVSALLQLPIRTIVRELRPAAESWPGLILEVTEDEIVRDLALANDVAKELQAARCSLALDDFGAGYSSIAGLKHLPFSELKIDRAYVTNCHIDRVNAGLCEVFIALAKRFGLTTVAEGVELVHESNKLLALGCDIGQGYLYAEPMSKEQFIGTMRRRPSGGPLPVPMPESSLSQPAPGLGKG